MYKKIHFFDQQLAKAIGQDEAILFYQIKYWISKCGRNINGYDGTWIYNSLKQWHSEHFNYWSMYKLRKTIKSLENSGLIKSTKANSKKWNHTKWYSINEEEYNSLLKDTYPDKKDLMLNTEDANSSDSLIDENLQVNYSTNRFVDNRQIINIQKNNYTNNSSYREKNLVQSSEKILEENFKNESTKYEKNSCTEEEKIIAKEMIHTWNEEFKYSLKPIKAYSDKKIVKKLYSIYQNQFRGNIDEWRDYALKVNSSKFLMGEKETKTGFKAVFQWLIKPEIVNAILNGSYGIGDRELDKNKLIQNIEKQKEEVVKQTNYKISEYIKDKISEEKEKAEFNAYVLGREFERDGDIYQMSKLVTNNTWLSPQSLIYDVSHKAVYQTLYESYVMKKYLGKTYMESSIEIKSKIDDLSQKNKGVTLLEKLKLVKNKIETAAFNEYKANSSNMMGVFTSRLTC